MPSKKRVPIEKKQVDANVIMNPDLLFDNDAISPPPPPRHRCTPSSYTGISDNTIVTTQQYQNQKEEIHNDLRRKGAIMEYL